MLNEKYFFTHFSKWYDIVIPSPLVHTDTLWHRSLFNVSSREQQDIATG